MIITFCGHSQFSKTWEHENNVMDFLEKNVGNEPADFYLGGYGNFDNFAYDCCQKYKQRHSNVSLIFVTPYITIEYQKRRLENLEKLYDGIIYPEIEEKPLKFAILYRNRWMIERADYIICSISHSWGGAYKSYRYAKKMKKRIYNITERELQSLK